MKPLKIIAKLMIILLVFSLISCDENIFSDYADDSSDEARLEAALIYLDDGEYAKAKEILLKLDQSDEEVKRALASAYAGMAGLEVPSLIAAIDDIDNSNAVDAVGEMLGDTDNNNELSQSEITDKLDKIGDAITAYKDLTQTDSVKAQLCVLYATRIILEVADGANGATNNPVYLDTSQTFSGSGYDFIQIQDDLDELNICLSSLDEDLRDGFQEIYNEMSGINNDIDMNTYLNSL